MSFEKKLEKLKSLDKEYFINRFSERLDCFNYGSSWRIICGN